MRLQGIILEGFEMFEGRDFFANLGQEADFRGSS